MKLDIARLGPLITKTAAARAPSRDLFVDVWFATIGEQNPDLSARFALFLEASAWTDAALITAAHALPGWVVMATMGSGQSEAKLRMSGAGHSATPSGLKAVRHPSGAALAILQAVLQAKAQGY